MHEALDLVVSNGVQTWSTSAVIEWDRCPQATHAAMDRDGSVLFFDREVYPNDIDLPGCPWYAGADLLDLEDALDTYRASHFTEGIGIFVINWRETLRQRPTMVQVDRSRFPGTCARCGQPAYEGLYTTECSNPGCRG